MGDITILNKGTISGSKELYGKLCSNNRKLSFDDFSGEFDDVDLLSPNTIVRFQKEEYALIKAPITRDKWGKINPVEKEDMTLELLLDAEKDKKISLGNRKLSTYRGIAPRNMMQYISLQYALLNPDVSMVFLVGGAGSGKTLLSYVAGLSQVLEYTEAELKERGWEDPFKRGISHNHNEIDILKKSSLAKTNKFAAVYNKFILLKPDNPVGGRETGFLPGNLWSKISPDLKPYSDAHELTTFSKDFSLKDLILHPTRENDYGHPRDKKLSDKLSRGGGRLPQKETMELTYSGKFRGRSFENTLMLIDEAQNFTPEEMRTIVSRMGVGSKLVIMGDPGLQVDNLALSGDYNGIVQTVEHYLDKSYSALINLGINYRSEISDDSLSMNP